MSLIFDDGTPFMNSSWKTQVGNKLAEQLAMSNPYIQQSAFLTQNANDMKFLGFEAAKRADDAQKHFEDLLNTQYDNLQGHSFSPSDNPTNKITPKSVKSVIDNAIDNAKDNTKGEKFTGKFLGLNAAGWGQAFDIARSVLPENRAYQGEEGNLARGLDTAYNGLSDAVSMFGPVGTLAGTIMKGGAFLNQGIAALGGGTDGMTKTDAILNSNFLGWTPLGLINGLAGSRADKYSRDSLVDAETNGSYGGFLNLEDESDKVSGKKYGLFSQSAKNAANDLVQNTTAQQISLGNIENTNRTNLMAAQGNTPFISNRIQLDYSGGVRQAQVGRDGLKFAKRVISKAKVKKVLDESTNKTVTIPTDLTNDQKMGREPITTSDGKAVYMTGDGNVISKIKKAQEGTILTDSTSTSKQYQEYKDGGKVNVIPEGALHAHKHHLEEVDEKFEDVTTKGIPVVTESKDGGLVQQAEVEKEEIIFRLDVTKKLEELKKKGTDEAAIEAGKLLVHEILHNTVDNADLIEKTN